MDRRNPRRSVHWAAYLWPGLPHLWISGSWAGLTLALSFTILLNVLMVTTLVWTEWLPRRVQLACGAVLGVIWIAALVETRLELRRLAARRGEDREGDARWPGGIGEPVEADQRQADGLLRQAQAAYLSGDWLAAERTLLELLRVSRRDVEGQLLLATLWRHCGRLTEAECQLDRLDRLEDAACWEFEISRERELIAAAKGGDRSDNRLPPNGETTPLAA